MGWELPGLDAMATDGEGGENCGWSREKSADGLGGVSGLCKLLREWPIECDRVGACVRWCNKKADDKSTSGETGESDWAIGPVVVVRRDLDDLLGRFSDENGLGGILLDGLGRVPPSVVGAAAVGEVAVLPALNDLRLNKLDRKAVFLLGTFAVAVVVCVSESVCDPSYGLGMRERTDLSERWDSGGLSNVISM